MDTKSKFATEPSLSGKINSCENSSPDSGNPGMQNCLIAKLVLCYQVINKHTLGLKVLIWKIRRPSTIELMANSGIYIPSGKLDIITKTNADNVNKMLKAIIRTQIPDEELADMNVLGGGAKIAFEPTMLKAVKDFVQMKTGKNQEKYKFNRVINLMCCRLYRMKYGDEQKETANEIGEKSKQKKKTSKSHNTKTKSKELLSSSNDSNIEVISSLKEPVALFTRSAGGSSPSEIQNTPEHDNNPNKRSNNSSCNNHSKESEDERKNENDLNNLESPHHSESQSSLDDDENNNTAIPIASNKRKPSERLSTIFSRRSSSISILNSSDETSRSPTILKRQQRERSETGNDASRSHASENFSEVKYNDMIFKNESIQDKNDKNRKQVSAPRDDLIQSNQNSGLSSSADSNIGKKDNYNSNSTNPIRRVTQEYDAQAFLQQPWNGQNPQSVQYQHSFHYQQSFVNPQTYYNPWNSQADNNSARSDYQDANYQFINPYVNNENYPSYDNSHKYQNL